MEMMGNWLRQSSIFPTTPVTSSTAFSVMQYAYSVPLDSDGETAALAAPMKSVVQLPARLLLPTSARKDRAQSAACLIGFDLDAKPCHMWRVHSFAHLSHPNDIPGKMDRSYANAVELNYLLRITARPYVHEVLEGQATAHLHF